MDDPFIPERLFGIIGHPLAQTLSPLLHNWGFTRMGVKAAFMAFPTPPERLDEFMRAVRALPVSGLSVTIPHKEAVMRHLEGVSELAKRAGAVNTLVWEDGKLIGHNTDVTGFLAPLREKLAAARLYDEEDTPGERSQAHPASAATGSAMESTPAPGAGGAAMSSALVLGAGGAARAVLAGLTDLGVSDVILCNRDRARAETLAAEFGRERPDTLCPGEVTGGARHLIVRPSAMRIAVVDWERREDVRADLVVNTTPLGMKGKAEDASPVSAGYWLAGQTAYDLVYNPRETLFLREAHAAGAATIDGLAMFAGQGAAQFKLWTGLELPMHEASALLARALGM